MGEVRRRTLGLCIREGGASPGSPPALHAACVDDGFALVFRGVLPFRLGPPISSATAKTRHPQPATTTAPTAQTAPATTTHGLAAAASPSGGCDQPRSAAQQLQEQGGSAAVDPEPTAVHVRPMEPRPQGFVENQSLLDALAAFRQQQPAPIRILLVGSNVDAAARALGLRRGEDIDETVDLREFFSYRDHLFGSRSYFEIRELAQAAGCASVNVRERDGSTAISQQHDTPAVVQEAALAVALYLQYCDASPEAMQRLHERVLNQKPW